MNQELVLQEGPQYMDASLVVGITRASATDLLVFNVNDYLFVSCRIFPSMVAVGLYVFG